MLPKDTKTDPKLSYKLSLPSNHSAAWRSEGGYFIKEDYSQWIGVSLSGPYALSQSGPDWVKSALEESRNFPGGEFEVERPFQMGELRGVETVQSTSDNRVHRFYATDGELGWLFEYGARRQAYSPETDAMFFKMIENRTR